MGSCRQTSITAIIALLGSSVMYGKVLPISSLDNDVQMCGTITYCQTLVRPGYCPDCLGDERLKAPTHAIVDPRSQIMDPRE